MFCTKYFSFSLIKINIYLNWFVFTVLKLNSHRAPICNLLVGNVLNTFRGIHCFLTLKACQLLVRMPLPNGYYGPQFFKSLFQKIAKTVPRCEQLLYTNEITSSLMTYCEKICQQKSLRWMNIVL